MNPQYIDSLLPPNTDPAFHFLALLVIFSFLPFLVLTTTPFLRIVVILSLIRQALGVQQVPPNLVLTGMSIILTFFVMGADFAEINQKALMPLSNKKITLGQAIAISYKPLQRHMLEQVDQKDVKFFYDLNEKILPERPEQIEFAYLLSAHVLSELRIAFSLGFLIFIPFLVIDLIVANILLALGMQMLQPTIISLPFKLMIFVAVDGWALAIKGLLESFK